MFANCLFLSTATSRFKLLPILLYLTTSKTPNPNIFPTLNLQAQSQTKMHISSLLPTTTFLAMLSLLNPVTAGPNDECGISWRGQCTQAWTECCWIGAEQANTTCEITRNLHYWAVGRCAALHASAQEYGKTDCGTARLAGIALLAGDRDGGLACSLADIEGSMEYPGEGEE